MALFVPVLSGEAHAARAIAAGQADLAALEVPELVAGGVSVGVGVHTGRAFVGAVGTAERIDSSALGDTVNVAARLGSVARRRAAREFDGVGRGRSGRRAGGDR
jgi:adenylate cyclase